MKFDRKRSISGVGIVSWNGVWLQNLMMVVVVGIEDWRNDGKNNLFMCREGGKLVSRHRDVLITDHNI